MVAKTPDPRFIPQLLRALPHEIRLAIFESVFQGLFLGRAIVEVRNVAGKTSLSMADKHDASEYSGAMSFLDTSVVGRTIATAAAEALYRSQFMFAIDAETLPDFLELCPLSRTVRPAQYIRRINLYMDEAPNFVGEKEIYGQMLREADWVDLDSDDPDTKLTRSNRRTYVMRKCWKSLLKMLKLKRLEFWIMPAQGKVSLQQAQRCEVRDILPTYFRLCLKSVDTYLYVRTWEQDERENEIEWFRTRKRGLTRNGFFESHVDLSMCFPFRPRCPQTPLDVYRARAAAELARHEHWSLPPGCYREHMKRQVTNNYEDINELYDRLKASSSTL